MLDANGNASLLTKLRQEVDDVLDTLKSHTII